MSKIVIQHKGFDILHRHEFNRVYFSAWKGDNPVRGNDELERYIQADNRFIDWNNPLTENEKDWLIEPAIKVSVL